MEKPIVFSPYSGSSLFRLIRRVPTAVTWLVVPILLIIVVVVAAAQHTFLGDGRFSGWQDLRTVLGAHIARNSDPDFPLLRDLSSLLLFVLIGMTIVCLHFQLRILDLHFTRIRNGDETWKWKNSDQPQSRLVTWALAGARVGGRKVGSKKAFRLLLSYHSLPRLGRDVLMAVCAVAAAVGISFYEKYVHVFAPFAPASGDTAWESRAYDSWWASWHHPAGAIVYVLLVAAGIYTILAQNIMSMTMVKVLILFHIVADFGVDWLNVDGSYGWGAVRRFFRSVYCSILLRAAQLTIAVLILDVRNYYFVGIAATLWTAFIVVYVAVPQVIFKGKFELIRRGRLDQLVAGFNSRDLDAACPSPDTESYLREIERVRTARINPLGLAKWESSGFSIIVLFPVLLTIAQIVATV